jgi:hypothetical protein
MYNALADELVNKASADAVNPVASARIETNVVR